MNPDESKTPLVLVTVPACNEALNIEACVEELARLLPAEDYRYRLHIVEDGSTDGTAEIIQRLEKRFSYLSFTHDANRLGRGLALRGAWSRIKADVYAFTDADLPGQVDAVQKVIRSVLSGSDIATASRYAKGAHTIRPPLRAGISRLYNWYVRVAFGSNLQDHQCGVKAFTRNAIQSLLEISREDTWFWDTEVMVLAQRLGLRISEIPISWIERRYHRTSLRRLASDVIIHGSGLIRLNENAKRPSVHILSRRVADPLPIRSFPHARSP